MRRILVIVAFAAAVGACAPHEQNAAAGGLVGAGAGAIIGGATTGRTSGALAGAAIGGATGAIIGSAATPRRTCYGRDEWGRRVRFAC